MTGFTLFEYSMSAKWLELLKEIAPGVKRVAVIRDPSVPAGSGGLAAIQTVARHDWCVVPNLVRGMVLTGLDQLCVADITYIRLLEEFAFLAVLLDAFSRRVIGWASEKHLRASLALTALEMAIQARRPARGSLIHHSDRGVQYASGDYTAVLAAYDIQPSTRRIG